MGRLNTVWVAAVAGVGPVALVCACDPELLAEGTALGPHCLRAWLGGDWAATRDRGAPAPAVPSGLGDCEILVC